MFHQEPEKFRQITIKHKISPEVYRDLYKVEKHACEEYLKSKFNETVFTDRKGKIHTYKAWVHYNFCIKHCPTLPMGINNNI